MPWKTSKRRDRLPPNWLDLTAEIHRRSGRRCEFIMESGARCPRYADGGVDHIIAGDDHRPENLRDSCQYHHGKKSSAEGLEARKARPVKRFGQEKHPRRGSSSSS